jgi:hypothetical protein
MAGKKILPRLKKTVSAFMSNEEGRILKKSIITIGAVAGGVAISNLLSDIIPIVEAYSHSAHSFIWSTNTISASWVGADCAIKPSHSLHNSHSKSISK